MKKEYQPYYVINSYSEFGRSRIEIECPYCKTRVWAYLWSLAGCGKRCPGCGAIHRMYSGTAREIKDEEN